MKTGLLLVMMASAASIAAGQETRGIVPEEVLRARQAKSAAAPATAPRYQPVSTAAMSRPASARQVGVTIWNLRPAAAGEKGARLLVQQDNETTAWVPERVASNSALHPGDRVRISVESPEPGYLYVVDRERYASGERGTPYLIFPTLRTRNGDNQVKAGRLIDIPAQDDRPNFFTLETSRPGQTEEELTVLLAPHPLEGIRIGRTPLALSPEQMAKWESQWGRKAEAFELAGGAGRRWTGAEQRAAAESERLLTQADPPPQTVYRVEAASDIPVLVKVRLRYLPDGK
jgi:hypothetical protein